jgi:hypothetical protein
VIADLKQANDGASRLRLARLLPLLMPPILASIVPRD